MKKTILIGSIILITFQFLAACERQTEAENPNYQLPDGTICDDMTPVCVQAWNQDTGQVTAPFEPTEMMPTRETICTFDLPKCYFTKND